MDRRLRNRIVIFLVLAAIVAFALVRLSGRQPVAKISAVTPARENLISSISTNGKVEPIAPFVVRAQLNTFVERISAVEGQAVKKGQLLLELNVKDAAAQLADARSKLLRAEDDLRAAKAGGRSDEAAKTEGQLAGALAQRDRLKRNHDSLERLIAQQAATKDELAANDLDLAKADALVKQLTAAKQEFEHGVKLSANSTSLQVELLCEVNNDKLELLPNINVNVRINSHERINVLTVPRGAVEAEGGQRFVFVVLRNALGVGKATLEKREIHVGIADATNYEVVGGLQEGEMVALPGDVDLKDKMPVRIVNTDVSYIRGRSESN